MKLLLAHVLVLLLSQGSNGVNPGVILQVNQMALDYAKATGINILQRSLKNMTIPPVSGSKGIIHYSVANLKVSKLDAPMERTRFQLINNEGILIEINGWSMDITADYNMKLGIISKSGSVTASAAIYQFGFEIYVATNNESKPVITADNCKIGVGRITIRLHGNVFDSIINWFHVQIESAVQKAILDNACPQIITLIDDNVNQAIAKIPTSGSLMLNLYVGWGLTSQPVVTADYMQVSSVLEFFLLDSKDIPIVAPPLPELSYDDSRMVQAVISDYVINTGIIAAMDMGFSHFVLTKALLKTIAPQLVHYLNTTCPGMQLCIGRIIPGIGIEYPNNFVSLNLTMIEMPNVTIASSGLDLNIDIKMDFVISQGTPNETNILSMGLLYVITLSNFQLESSKNGTYLLKAKLYAADPTVSLFSSTLVGMNRLMLQVAFDLITKAGINVELANKLAKGIPIPGIKKIAVQGIVVETEMNSFAMAMNITYID